ncbi:hypothetical protein ACHWQZ_G009305 [Mnemiopsis leidyi]
MLQADKLRNAHQLNRETVDQKIQYMQKCDKDYGELTETLKKLSSEHKLDIMVPLTKKAFMPGQLVHTGEVMVYLGDSWFVNRTVNQGIEIAERRRERIQKELGEYKLCLDNIENKLDMTSELEDGIVEELTEEDIKRSENRSKAHAPKANVPIPRPAFTPEELAAFKTIKTEGATSSEDEEEIHDRSQTSDSPNEHPLKSILKKSSGRTQISSSDEADDELEEDAIILFSHSSNLPSHDNSELHPGNLHRLLARLDLDASKSKEDSHPAVKKPSPSPLKKPSRQNDKFDINESLVKERTNPGQETNTVKPAPDQRPVSRFKMSRSR